MRRKWNHYAAVCLAAGLAVTQLGGCGQSTGTTAAESTAQSSEDSTDRSAQNAGTSDTDRSETAELTAQLGEGGTKTVTFDAEDLDSSWDETAATTIRLEGTSITADGDGAAVDGSTVTISKAGTYVVSGTLTDGQIHIDAGEEDLVHLVFNGAAISNTATAPIYSEGKGKVVLTLAAGTENAVADGTEYVYENATDDEPDAPIFIKGDLTINGEGKLSVQGNYQSGIRSKDNLKVMSGVITIQAQDDGLKGKDSVVIRDGILDITAVKDGIKSNEDEDADKGFIWINGGEITVSADDDGIQAETALIIAGGEINITKSQEALAGKTVDILDGVIHAVASDDGINSAASVATEQEKMMDQEGVYTRIAGGEIYLNASADGIDSNGDLYMEGGTLYLSGPVSGGDGILDYNGTASLTGGTMIAAGSSGMMQTFGEDAEQNYFVIYYTETQKGGTLIAVTDEAGEELVSFAPEKDYQAAIITSPEIETGKTYQVTTGEETIDMEVSSVLTSYGSGGGFGGGRGGFGGPGGGMGGGPGRGDMNGEGGQRGQMKPGEGTLPDGETMPEIGDGQTPPDMDEMPEGMTPPEMGDGQTPPELPEGETLPDGMGGGRGGMGGGRGMRQDGTESGTDGTTTAAVQ